MREFLGGRGRVVWMGGNGVEGGENIFYLILIAVSATRPCFAHSFNSWISPLPDLSATPPFISQSSYKLVAHLFTVLSGSGLASMQFSGFLSQVVSPLNLDPSRFSLHSFRRGGVTFAFDCHISHIPSEHTKLQGDWQSDACLVYSELSQQQSFSLCFWSN